MKKFEADRPGYGLFEFSARQPELKPSLAFSDVGRRQGPSPYDFIPSVGSSRRKARFYQRRGKRLFDVVLILIALPLALPIILLCAAALWLEGGAPFYAQQRLGRNGKLFWIFKLRTMTRDADAVLESYLARDPDMRREWDELQKIKKDPRITPVGQFLRATSLDELPQLFNVLIGDMSLVGPRPMMPDQLSMYGNPNAYFALRPGITGFWQTSARNNNRFSYRHEVDLQYSSSVSLLCDIKVLLKTVAVVLRRTGY